MNNFTVMKGFELVDGKDATYWIVLSPDGEAVYSAKFEYMAHDRARLLNEATETLRRQVVQLEMLSKQLAGDLMKANIRIGYMQGAFDEILSSTYLKVSHCKRIAKRALSGGEQS